MTLTRKEITNSLAEFELNQEIGKYVVNDINIWPLLKMTLAFMLYRSYTVDKKKIQYLKKLINHFAPYLKTLFFDHKNNAQLYSNYNPDICFLTYSNDRRHYIYNKGWFNVYSDPFTKLFPELSILNLEIATNECIRYPRYNPSILINGKLLLSRIKNKLKKTEYLNSNSPSWLNDFLDLCSSLSKPISKEKIMQELSLFFEISSLFKSLLKRISPKVVFQICWYEKTRMAATLAAKELGIPTVDFQHGMQSSEHFGYSGWIKNDISIGKLIPDFFWVWGKNDQKSLIKNNPILSPNRIVVGGNPWLNIWTEKTSTSFLQERENCFNYGMNKTALLTLHTFDAIELNFVQQLLSLLPPSWICLLRLHPSLKQSKSKLLKQIKEYKGKYDAELPNKLPLYTLFKTIDIHITGFSTCAIEAIPFGLKTILFHPNGKNGFANYIKNGLMIFENKADNVIAYMNNLKLCCNQRYDYSDIFANTNKTRSALRSLIK